MDEELKLFIGNSEVGTPGSPPWQGELWYKIHTEMGLKNEWGKDLGILFSEILSVSSVCQIYRWSK